MKSNCDHNLQCDTSLVPSTCGFFKESKQYNRVGCCTFQGRSNECYNIEAFPKKTDDQSEKGFLVCKDILDPKQVRIDIELEPLYGYSDLDRPMECRWC